MGNDWIEDTYFQSLAEADFQSLADETGGKLFNADNASQVVDVLIEAIQTPIDDNQAPTALKLDNKTIDENVAPKSVVGKFSTIDPDQGDSSTYELVTDAVDTDNSTFSINSDQQLQINDSPNFETKSSYSIRVKTYPLSKLG